jgi:hypothetical protein
MLDLHVDSAEDWKLAQNEWIKVNAGHTAAIGLTVSITHLMTFTALSHVFIVFIVLIASSARQRVAREVSVSFSVTGRTGVPLSMGRSPLWDNGNTGAVNDVSCMASALAGTVKRTAVPSATGIWATVGLGVLTTPVREGPVSGDMVIVRENVFDSVECISGPSALVKSISTSIYSMLSKMYQKQF